MRDRPKHTNIEQWWSRRCDSECDTKAALDARQLARDLIDHRNLSFERLQDQGMLTTKAEKRALANRNERDEARAERDRLQRERDDAHELTAEALRERDRLKDYLETERRRLMGICEQAQVKRDKLQAKLDEIRGECRQLQAQLDQQGAPAPLSARLQIAKDIFARMVGSPIYEKADRFEMTGAALSLADELIFQDLTTPTPGEKA